MRDQVYRVLSGQYGLVSDPSTRLKYAVACGAAMVGLAVRLALDPVLGPHSPYLVSTIAVIFAAWFGGWGPGFASVAISAAGILFFFTPPRNSFLIANSQEAAEFARYVAVDSLITLLVGYIRQSVLSTTRSEDARRRLAEQRGLALEAADMGAWEYNLDTRDVFWDDRCARIFGVSTGGHIDYDEGIVLIHPDDRLAADEALKDAIGRASGAYDREFRVVWPDGSVHWVALHGRFLEAASQHPRAVRFAGVCTEISERRQAEERLLQTQKLENVGLLAAGIAHDFNNLLTVIMGSASAVLAQRPTCQHSQAILSASERAADLTRQLLAYSGKGQAILKLVDLTELVSKARGLLSASIPKRVRLTFKLSTTLPALEADPSQIEQILMNLVINAGEAMSPKTDGLIEVQTSTCKLTPNLARQHSKAYDVADGDYVCLEVRDNGSGVDETIAARIFDPFFSTKFTGRGLGLAAVYGIVRASRGFIEVHSSPGAGTTFQVFLPASGRKRLADLAPGECRQPPRGSLTILVVDDEEMVRKLACTALKQQGYEVLESKDGRAALQALADSQSLPSVILLDMAMPVMGGDELIPILRTKYPDVKIIISSGYPEEVAGKDFQSGFPDFLQKPYTVAALAEKVAEVLGRNRPTAESSTAATEDGPQRVT